MVTFSSCHVHTFSLHRCHHFLRTSASLPVPDALKHFKASVPIPQQQVDGKISSLCVGRLRDKSSGSGSAFSPLPGSSRLFSSSSDSTQYGGEARKRIVFLGTPEVASSTLRKLHRASTSGSVGGGDVPFEIVSVITQPPKRRRRNGKEEASPVGMVAEELGLTVLTPEKANDADFLDYLSQEVRPDLCITAAYGQYLPKRFLSAPTLGTVNIHPSLLPRWRGASPVQRSLEAGDNPVGVTVLFTVSKMDAGPIIAQQEVWVDENDDATKVLPWLFDIGTDLLVEKIPYLLSGRITMETARMQDESQVVAAAMIDSSEAELRPWEESATAMHNRLRGFAMWPGAFMFLEVGEGTEPTKYKILETRVLLNEEGPIMEPTDRVQPGPSKKDGLRVVSADGSVLEIMKLQPATKKPVDALSFVNGLQGRAVRYVRTPNVVVASAPT
jgi:methionyl-tRNA formyltransferase